MENVDNTQPELEGFKHFYPLQKLTASQALQRCIYQDAVETSRYVWLILCRKWQPREKARLQVSAGWTKGNSGSHAEFLSPTWYSFTQFEWHIRQQQVVEPWIKCCAFLGSFSLFLSFPFPDLLTSFPVDAWSVYPVQEGEMTNQSCYCGSLKGPSCLSSFSDSFAAVSLKRQRTPSRKTVFLRGAFSWLSPYSSCGLSLALPQTLRQQRRSKAFR